MNVIAAYSGGALPAAIGIIRLSGEGSFTLLDKMFKPKCRVPSEKRDHAKLYYGKLVNADGQTVDLCTAACFKAPHSYTGEDMAEIYCHGSSAVVDAALKTALRLGAKSAEPGEFTRRAFLNGKLDLCKAEATADLIYSTSELSARAAASQLSGSVSNEISALRETVAAALAHFYAVCDYTDEDIDPFDCEKAAETLDSVADSLDRLYDGFLRSGAVREGIRIAVIGKPNAGKSSLFNALAGFDRAIVTSEAGTTRDVVEEVFTLDGALFRLSDTAGIRDAESLAEEMGIKLSRETAEKAQCVICVFDGSAPLSDEDKKAAALIPEGVCRCAVINKSDLPLKLSEKTVSELGFENVFTLSAKDRSGLSPLLELLRSLIPDLSGTLITSPRQAALLKTAAEALRLSAGSAQSGMTADAFLSDAERALSALGKITGDTADADIASEIFSRFCVGK